MNRFFKIHYDPRNNCIVGVNTCGDEGVQLLSITPSRGKLPDKPHLIGRHFANIHAISDELYKDYTPATEYGLDQLLIAPDEYLAWLTKVDACVTDEDFPRAVFSAELLPGDVMMLNCSVDDVTLCQQPIAHTRWQFIQPRVINMYQKNKTRGK